MTIEQACQILQIDQNATYEQATEKYRQLRAELRDKQFQSGEAGNEASRQLGNLDTAYDVFKRFTTQHSERNGSSFYDRVEESIKKGDINTAQEMLDDTSYRDAEWHYLQSIIFYKKSWYIESKKQLEMAVNMQPDNIKYKDSLSKLDKILASKTVSPESLRGENYSRPVGGQHNYGNNGTCTGSCCGDVCLANLCCECCCRGCGGC